MKPRYDPRIFLALQLSRTTQERLHAAQTEVAKYLAKWHLIPPEAFHLTLKFFGETPEPEVERIHAACQAMSQELHPFQLRFDQLDYFGSPEGARVLFASTGESPGLSALVKSIQLAFAADSDPRQAFRPHVTLAKARKQMDRPTQNFNAVLLKRLRDQGRIGSEQIELGIPSVHREFVLMETVWVGRMVEYVIRERYRFPEESLVG